jgi:LPXTG-motif cell wall-anchored protein
MGEAADRKVKEIEETRSRVDDDLRELEERLPSPVRSAKTVAGAVAGSSVMAGSLGWVMRRRKKKRKQQERTTEVVVRVVREDPIITVDGEPSGKRAKR